MSGTVYAIEYQGAFVKVTMRIVGDEEFVAYLRDDQFLRNPVEIGDTATASWQRDDLHLLRADLGRAALDAGRPIGTRNAPGRYRRKERRPALQRGIGQCEQAPSTRACASTAALRTVGRVLRRSLKQGVSHRRRALRPTPETSKRPNAA